MTWAPIARPVGAKPRGGPVRISANQPGRYGPVLLVTLHAPALADVAFLRAGGRVAALRGVGEHAGQIRLQPGETFALGKAAGRAGMAGWLLLRLPLPPGVAPGRRVGVECEHDWGDDWLEITLPPWATPTGDALAAAMTAPPPPSPPPPGKRLLTDAVLSHPQFASPRGQAAHAAATKGTR